MRWGSVMARKMHDDDDDDNNDNNNYVPDTRGYQHGGRLVPIPDPTALTNKMVKEAIVSLKDELQVRFDAINEATKLVHADYVRVPTQVDRAVGSLRELLEAKHTTIDGRLDKLAEVSEERFKSIQTQFTLLKQATEQLDLANKTAIAAALQAQKESAGETQKSSQAAIAKSETSTSEAIKALTTTINAANTATNDRINDLKGRMDRGEGKANVADPALTETLRTINGSINNQRDVIQSLTSRSDINEGHQDARKDMTGWIVAAATAVVSALIFLAQRGHV